MLFVLKTIIFSDIAPSFNISTLHVNYLILNNYCYLFVFII